MFKKVEIVIVEKIVFAPVQLFGLLLTLAACYRLAKFNIDTRQVDSFIGLPTPAMSLFVISIPLIVEFSKYSLITDLIQNTYFLIATSVVLSILMNIELTLFSLKFRRFGIKENGLKYLFILVSFILIISLQFISIPLIILIYIFLSLIKNTPNYGRIH